MPGWNQFSKLLTDPRTAPYRDRLMLCPNTYNSKDYLFANARIFRWGDTSIASRNVWVRPLRAVVNCEYVLNNWVPGPLSNASE